MRNPENQTSTYQSCQGSRTNQLAYDPTLGQFLSPDPFVQAPENSQNYNRFAYCLNNPLKYNDPSGYWNTNIFIDDMPYFGSSWGLGNWIGENCDNIFSLNGGNGNSILGSRFFNDWKGHQYFTGLSSMYNESYNTFEATTSDDNRSNRYTGVNIFNNAQYFLNTTDEPEFTAKDQENNTLAGFFINSYFSDKITEVIGNPMFYGVDIKFTSNDASGYAIGAIWTKQSNFNEYKSKGLSSWAGNHLMHEFGHGLAEKYGGKGNYYGNIVPTSLINMELYRIRKGDCTRFEKIIGKILDISKPGNYNEVYNNSWTEIQANTMSYYYFNYPKSWDFSEYPINSNFLSTDLKSRLYYHLP